MGKTALSLRAEERKGEEISPWGEEEFIPDLPRE
jgi:hypothetical protein